MEASGFHGQNSNRLKEVFDIFHEKIDYEQYCIAKIRYVEGIGPVTASRIVDRTYLLLKSDAFDDLERWQEEMRGIPRFSVTSQNRFFEAFDSVLSAYEAVKEAVQRCELSWMSLESDFERRATIDFSKTHYAKMLSTGWPVLSQHIWQVVHKEKRDFENLLSIDGFGEIAFYSMVRFFMEERNVEVVGAITG